MNKFEDFQAYGRKGARSAFRRKMLNRADDVPPDEVLTFLPERHRFKQGAWIGLDQNLKFLALCRNPKLQMRDIAAIMNCDFVAKGQPNLYDKSMCQSRLNWLRLTWKKRSR